MTGGEPCGCTRSVVSVQSRVSSLSWKPARNSSKLPRHAPSGHLMVSGREGLALCALSG